MSGVLKELVEKRKELKKRIPTFKRVNASRYPRKLGDIWRKQRGRHNKIRRAIKGAGAKVSIGYGTLKEARNVHPAGYIEIIVNNVKDLDKIKDPSKEAIRIASKVGLKKRLEILKEAKKRKIHILNANIIARVKKKGFSSLKDMIAALSIKKEEKNKEKEEKSGKEEKSKEKTETSKTKKSKKTPAKKQTTKKIKK